MEDERIIDLYWQRKEEAVLETERKFGHYLTKIAYNILADWEDSAESVNDAYLAAWNSIPPQRPVCLSAYLGQITRRISIDIYRKRKRMKRPRTEYGVSLSELEDCLSAGDTTQQHVDLHLLAKAVNDYLRTLSVEARDLFIGRYYFADSVRNAAGYCGMSESKAKSMLYRTRQGLKKHLEKEGFYEE